MTPFQHCVTHFLQNCHPERSEGSAVGVQNRPVRTARNVLAIAFVLCGWLVSSIAACAADSSDHRFQWSSDKFAAQCSFEYEDYLKAGKRSFTDLNYSDKWNPIKAEKLKKCQNCYRFAELAEVGKFRIVRLSMDSESGDWLHETHYCFEESGKLRALQSVFNCAWGWSYVRVFSLENGNLKLLASKWQELESGKEISQPDNADDMKDHWNDIPLFKAFADMPFARLVTN